MSVIFSGFAYNPGFSFFFVAVTTLVTGAVLMMWLGEQITERGIGNGISMLIFAGIVAGMPGAVGQALESARQGQLHLIGLMFIAILAMAVVYCVVFIERGDRESVV